MKLALGTVQFGLDYGVSNKNGQTSIEEVSKIIDCAYENKIFYLDTARAYGNSEEILGGLIKKEQNKFKIITKTGVINLKRELNKSLDNLGKKSIYGLLFHNADDFINNFSSSFLKEIIEIKTEGLVEKIGISVYNPEQLSKIEALFDIDIVQIPLNVLDQKFLQNNYLKKLKEKNIEIHSRSVFLQGLLTMDIEKINSYFAPIKPLLSSYFECIQSKNISKTEAALGFVKNIPEVDKIVIGVNNTAQLIENINSYRALTDLDFKNFVCYNESCVNPAMWNIN